MPAMDYNTVCDADEPISVKVEAPDLCPRYMAHYVRNIRMSESPRWMKRHLALCGLRSISNVVDITNHTLLEMGQPMHAFDLNKVAGRSITVRRAVEGEKITTLDEKEFTLNPNNLVICDAEKPVALAGIMGGANSGMDDNTTSLLFECATFARDSVRKTSRALGQNSDSSARYEKGVDRHSPELGLARALHLIQELDCGDITTLEYDLTDGRPLERKHIVTTPAKICGVLGMKIYFPKVKEITQEEQDVTYLFTISDERFFLLKNGLDGELEGYGWEKPVIFRNAHCPDQTMIDIPSALSSPWTCRPTAAGTSPHPSTVRMWRASPTWPRKSSVSTAMTTSYPPS